MQTGRNVTNFWKRVCFRILWPTRFPDFNPQDIFLWSLLKGKVYTDKPRTDITQNIRQKTAVIPVGMLQRTVTNLKHRAHSCMNGVGFSLQHLTGCSFTRTEAYPCNIWKISVRKCWVHCWKSKATIETLFILIRKKLKSPDAVKRSFKPNFLCG